MNKLLHDWSKVPSSAVNLGSHSSGRLEPPCRPLGLVVSRSGRLRATKQKNPQASAYQRAGSKTREEVTSYHKVRLTWIFGRKGGEGFCEDRERVGQTWRDGSRETEGERAVR